MQTAHGIVPILSGAAVFLVLASTGIAQEVTATLRGPATAFPRIAGLSPMTITVLSFGVCATLYSAILNLFWPTDHLYRENRDSNSEQSERKAKGARIAETGKVDRPMKSFRAKTSPGLLNFRAWKCNLSLVMPFAFTVLAWNPAQAVTSTNLDPIKSYLVTQVTKLDAAAHDYDANAAAYQKIIDANGGNYDKAAIANGPELLALIKKMQGDYLNLHMNGYETIEGIAAGVRALVQFDIYFDSGVPKNQGATDSPVAPVTLRDPSGKTIVDRDGNLYHYVIEPCLYGAKAIFVRKLSPEASQALHGIKYLPLATVTSASAKDAAREADIFLAACKAWQLKLDECIGALVWMTPTFNTYYDDLRDSLYGPNPSAYISETRVKDMRGIMGSLNLTYGALEPELEKKDPALARQLKDEYAGIMSYIDQSDVRDQKARAAHSKLSRVELEEMANHAKSMSDQLGPQIKQAAAIMGVQIPRKPYL